MYENQPALAVSRGNIYSDALSPDQPRGLVFLRGQLYNQWTTYSGGTSLAYFDGNVRGVQQTTPEFQRKCVDPPVVYNRMSNPKSSFYPNVDGIFSIDQYDHDDVSYMQQQVAWALRQ